MAKRIYQIGEKLVDLDDGDQVRALTPTELTDLLVQAGEREPDPNRSRIELKHVQPPEGTKIAWFNPSGKHERT